MELGKRFPGSRLTPKIYVDEGKYLFSCDCGTEKEILANNVVYGLTKSCGCYRKEFGSKVGKITKHGMYKHPLYILIKEIIYRCYKTTSPNYKNYGARGIRVSSDWTTNKFRFIDWALNHGWKEGLTIDRIDNNGHYSPYNCRFTTVKEQNNNKRNTKYVTVFGETLPFGKAVEKYGKVSYRRTWRRLERGWTVEDALTRLPRDYPTNLSK